MRKCLVVMFSFQKRGFCTILSCVVGSLLFFINPVVSKHVEQRVTLKFLVKSGKTPIECWRSLHDVWASETMSKTQVRFWHKRFREGDDQVTDAPHPGRPKSQRTPQNITWISTLVEDDARLGVRSLSAMTGISTHTIRLILKKDLQMRRRCAKFVPKQLEETHKWTRMTICSDNIDRLCSETDPEAFLRRIVMGDETWVSTFQQETKQATTEWVHKGANHPKKLLTGWGVKKVMATVFFDWQGEIHCEFLPPKTTIKAETYIKTLASLKENIRRKRPQLWKDRNFILHHDNASPHTAQPTVKKLQEWGVEVMEHPAYSPDLAPCDFALFPQLKAKMRGQKFENVDQLKSETRKILFSLPKDLFNDAIHDLVIRWQKYVAVNGEYFEGDGVVIDPLFAKGPAEDSDSSSDDSSC